MRPKIDRASLVLGLEEIGVTGRRRKTERDGECWFCAAKGGCKSCGSKDIVEGEGDEKPDITGFKRIRELGSLKGKEVARKRPKIERQDSYAQIPTRISHYPDPNVSTQWQQPYPHTQLYNPDPQGRGHTPKVFNQEHESYSQDFGAEEASYDGLPSSETHEGFGTNWQAINSPQSNVPGASNAATEQYRSSKVSSNEAPFQQFHPVPHAASSKQIELQRGQISRTSNQSRQYKVGAPEIKLQEYPSPAQQTPEPYLQHAPRLINYENTGFSQTRLNDSRISNPGLNYPDLYGEYPAIQPDEASKYSNSNNIVQHQTGSDEYQGFMPLQHNSHNYILPASKIDPALQDTLIEQSAEGKSSGGKQQSNHADEDVFNSHYYSNDYTPYLDPNIQQSHQDMSSFVSKAI